MLFKILTFAMAISGFCRWAFGKWPWEYLRPVPTRTQALFRARKLLSVSAGASRADIVEAHRRLLMMVHPDKGGSNTQVHEANAARDLLLDELPFESPR